MLQKLCAIAGAAALGLAMWLWVQRIAIPRQQEEAAAQNTPRGNLSDLYPRWLGARELLLHGRDPYGPDLTREIQTGYYGRPLDASRPNDPKDQQAFAYPLYVVFVLAPTVRLPFPLVQRIFLVLLVLLTAWSVPLWLRALGWRVSRSTRLIWILLTLGSFPAIQGFKLQQLSLLVASLLAAAVSLLVCGFPLLAGFLMGLASIKPQLVVLPAICLCLWSLGNWRERQRFVWGFGITMLALIGGGEILRPGWISEFRRASARYWQYTGGGRSVLDVELSPLWGRLVAVALVAFLLANTWRLRKAASRTPEFNWLLGLMMATMLMVIPMFAPYNQVLLVPALMVIAYAARTIWNAGLAARLFLVLTGSAVFWPWISAASLVLALTFLPAWQVRRAWVWPLATNFAIPTLTLGLFLVGRKWHQFAPKLRPEQ
jgi:hypothetical protein